MSCSSSSIGSTPSLPKRVNVLGQPIDCVTMDQTLDLIREYLEGNATKLILTADSNGVVSAEKDDNYARIFREAALITPDSNGPVWALRKLGHEIPDRVSGVELVERLCALSEELGFSIFFLGAAPGVAALAAKHLKDKYPKMVLAGSRDGYFKKSEDIEIANEVALTKPDVLLVAMGMPRQELFILDTAHAIKAKIGVGVGGSFDVHSGTVKRAPKLIQKIKLEWLWRVLLNPKKIAKVKNLPVFWWRIQTRGRRPSQ